MQLKSMRNLKTIYKLNEANWRTTAALIESFSWKSVTKACLDAAGVLPSIRMQSTFFFWKFEVIVR